MLLCLLHVSSKIATDTVRHQSVWYSCGKLSGASLVLEEVPDHDTVTLVRVPGDIDTVLYSEPQLVKCGSSMHGQLAAEEREQNTAKVMHWSN